MSDIINNTFDIHSCKSMIFGGSLFDTRDTSGYSEGEMSAYRNHRSLSPTNALNFYPQLEQVWEDSRDKDDKQMLCGTALWLNGFGPPYEDSVKPENANEQCAAFLKNRGVWTTDQILRSRPDYMLETLFGCFKWHGTDERMVSDDRLIDTAVSKLIRRGLVCRPWTQNPIGVRYMITVKASSKSKYDFVYMIGGSPDMIEDDMSKTAVAISQAYKKAHSILEDQAGKQIPNEIRNHQQINDPKYCWYQYKEDDFGEEFNSHPLTKARRHMLYVSRAIQGIVYIHNSLLYAKNHLKIKTLKEYNGSSTPSKVKIDDVIDRYQGAYDHCKTLTFMFDDIAEGKLG